MKFGPIDGWKNFRHSTELLDELWALASAEEWHYLNLAAGSSIWESRRDASALGAELDSEGCLMELWSDAGHAFELLAPLVARFGLILTRGGEEV